ncbi:MAG: SMI1/KNR4 family protein [Planctomycetia bacterium]|nr:SMI1/KNR4 family protein [Planctomycetia bacterium]
MSDALYINGLPLPVALVDAIESGIWQTPKNRDVWHSLFPDAEIVQPTLYSLRAMTGETSWLSEAGSAYLGRAAEGFVPGDIDPSHAVLIADLGPDRLIALDYRESETRPSVVALTSAEHSCWRQVADDIESFMRAIRLIS